MSARKLIRSLGAALLAVWYLLAAIGFDVHHDNHDHHFYVVSLLTGISCEDVHPEDECGCCHSHSEEDDCTDEIHQITVTGTDQYPVLDLAPLTVIAQNLSIELPAAALPTSRQHSAASTFSRPDIIHSYCILRV